MKLKTVFLLLAVFSFTNLRADYVPFESNNLLPNSNISYSTGWRCDQYRIIENDFVGDVFVGGNKEKYHDINIWQVGVQGTLSIPGCYTECGWDWLSQFYFKGYAYWGTVANGGTRTINFTKADGSFDGSSKRKARTGDTYDYQISLGCLYPITCEFGLAPIVGYSWDQQTMRPSTLVSFELPTTPASSIAEYYKYNWKGPFLGLEVVYDLCDVRLDAGYEYHWVKSTYELKANRFDVDPENCSARSQLAEKHHAQAHVAYLDATWNVSDCWALKLGGKYRNFWAGTALAVNHPELTENCIVPSFKNDWHSWQITFDVAYRF